MSGELGAFFPFILGVLLLFSFCCGERMPGSPSCVKDPLLASLSRSEKFDGLSPKALLGHSVRIPPFFSGEATRRQVQKPLPPILFPFPFIYSFSTFLLV